MNKNSYLRFLNNAKITNKIVLLFDVMKLCRNKSTIYILSHFLFKHT